MGEVGAHARIGVVLDRRLRHVVEADPREHEIVVVATDQALETPPYG
jgi:hypothetical protein